MEKKKISPVVIVSLLIVGLTLLTASILLYSERMSQETEEETTDSPTETSMPTELDNGLTGDDIPTQVEGLSENSSIETTPVTNENGDVDIDSQIRAIEEELNAIDEGLYDENDISDASFDL